MQQIYVLRAEDESCTKIGRSYNPNSRCESIILTEQKKFYLLYESKRLEDAEAIEIELQIINKFKDFVIRGKEWLNVHPLEVIKFITSIVGLPSEETNPVLNEHNYKFPTWLDANTMFKNGEKFDESIRIGRASYIAYVKLLHNSKFITVGFANIGDAKRFVRHNKQKIKAVEVATELLYGLSYGDWKDKQINLKHLSEWRLI